VAVAIFFIGKPHIGTESVSWLCIVGAAPFAAMGFIKYHGMTAERFVWAWIRANLLVPKKLTFRATNMYYEAMRPSLEGGKRQ